MFFTLLVVYKLSYSHPDDIGWPQWLMRGVSDRVGHPQFGVLTTLYLDASIFLIENYILGNISSIYLFGD